MVALFDASIDGQWRATGVDIVEVWTCRVPADTTATVYGGLPLRFPLQPAGLVEVLDEHVTSYFSQLSFGVYAPTFVEGGEVMMSSTDEPQQCVDVALSIASPGAAAVLAVADAEHAPGENGGFGAAGEPWCAVSKCPAQLTRRAAYVAGNDFNPDLASAPPMDLVEHELGHLLGWSHSGVDEAGNYLSGIDLMSNSAAPRAVDATRTDGPDTLALNRVLAGWLARDVVWSAPASGGTVTLASGAAPPAAAPFARRLAVVGITDTSFLTVELLTPVGFNGHLAAAGIAVHRVVVRGGVIESITPLVGAAPFTDLLGPEESLDVDGWHLEVTTVSAGHIPDGSAAMWTVRIVPNLGS